MDLNELRKTNEYYGVFLDDWNFMQAAYDGTRALIRINAIKRHERESYKNYEKRLAQVFGFSYSKSIVDLLNHYLFRKTAKVVLPESLIANKQWDAFSKDCNLVEDPLQEFLLEQSRYASIQGHVGILIDKATSSYQTVGQELDAGVYPYVSAYRPTSILDWEFERDEANRPYLSFLKLRDDDGLYRIWTREKWEIWREVGDSITLPIIKTSSTGETVQTKKVVSTNTQVELVDEGANLLGEIPFVWLYNMPSSYLGIGTSDIGDIAYIDVSIIRNLSQGEEVIDYAAFPMMRKPMQETGAAEQQDETGPAVVLEFNPELPDSKPDWLEAPVAEPIGAIVDWISQKVAEIYRSANIGGLQATETTADAKSGVALRTEFQMLNSRLAVKARNLEKTHKRILYFWLKWQSLEGLQAEAQIEYPRDFDVENLAEDLANVLTAKTIVISDLFRKQLQKMVARRMLPSLNEDEMAEIDADIDAGPSEEDMQTLNFMSQGGLDEEVPPGEEDKNNEPPRRLKKRVQK